ncbi:unnamed protein product [Peronospora belbahrii]|uniref:Uncharacterized protein n=1 Tax=Peronospora belbahrii TaxID=622444 RepID=A0ABN8CQV2_9STRA|nr:unnamed protein product [Peronospora belbahrii]
MGVLGMLLASFYLENEKNAEDRVLTFPALNKSKQTASSVTSRAVDATFKLVREYIIISKQAKADEVFKANGLEKVMDDILLTHAKYTSWKNKVLSEYEYNDPAAFKAMYKTLIFKKDEARVLKIVQDGLKSETGSVVLLAEEMEEAMTNFLQRIE